MRADDAAAYQRDRYNRHKQDGVCTRCPNPAIAGQARCEACIADLKAERLARRTCKVCNVTGHVRCDHRDMGLCRDCPVPTKNERCGPCAERRRTTKLEQQREIGFLDRHTAISRGLCGRCHRRRIAKGSKGRCRTCLDYAAAHERQRS